MKSTGDLAANIVKLRDALRRAKYDGPVDAPALGLGEPAGYLPLLHGVLSRRNALEARRRARTRAQRTRAGKPPFSHETT